MSSSSIQNGCQKRLPKSRRENELRSDNVYLTATKMNGKNILAEFSQDMKRRCIQNSKTDYGVETNWLARNKDIQDSIFGGKDYANRFGGPTKGSYWKTI